MATPSPYPLSLTQALNAASQKVSRKFELLMSLDPEASRPYKLYVRLKDTPQRRAFDFENTKEVESFLKELAA